MPEYSVTWVQEAIIEAEDLLQAKNLSRFLLDLDFEEVSYEVEPTTRGR